VDKREYFIRAMAAGCYRYKGWVIEAFSITHPDNNLEHRNYPMALIRVEGAGYGFVNPEHPEGVEHIDGSDASQPLFQFMETTHTYANDLPNIKEAMETTYGNLLVNQLIFCHPFGDRMPYINEQIDISKVQKTIEKRLRDDPASDEPRDPTALYVSEYCRFNEAVLSLGGYNSLCVTSATRKTMTADPRIPEIRAALLEKYKGQLHDPVVQATIEGELKKIDREWMRGDPGENFYHKSKFYDVVRKKLFLVQGNAEGFGEPGEFIPGSLADGWDVRYLSAMNNSLRDGSYSRGAETALGGEVVKSNHRIFQNTSIIEDDCGSKTGMEITLTPDIITRFISNSILTADGLVELTESNLDSYANKTVTMRYPTYCVAEGANFCAVCAGKNVANTPNAISSYVAAIGSLFMSLFMRKMHGTVLRVVPLDFDGSLT
jgi:hypothetical protein